jgi:hypothetical protein
MDETAHEPAPSNTVEELRRIAMALRALDRTVACLAADVKRLADCTCGGNITGIVVVPEESSPATQEEPLMAKMNLTKTSPGGKKTAKALGGTPITTFNLQDNGNGSFTVLGVDAAGNQVDISAVATLAVTGGDPTILSTTVTGMTFVATAATPPPAVGASTTLTLTATWNDASAGIGPFTATLTGTITAGNAVGIVVTTP